MVRKSQRLTGSYTNNTWINILVDVAQVVHKHLLQPQKPVIIDTVAEDTEIEDKPRVAVSRSVLEISDERAALNSQILLLKDALYECTDEAHFWLIVEQINDLYDRRDAKEIHGEEKAYN